VKVLVLDTQVYSNTGGQACTSGFVSQIADMSPFGPQLKGKREIRKEISLIAMGHRTTFVLQGAQSHVTHLLEGYIDGLNSRRPALFNIYTVCEPEHGVGDDMANAQTKMAVESRAYPLLRYDPDAGETLGECLDLTGNPSMKTDWPEYTLKYIDEEGNEAKMKLPFTFADFAATEGRFRKHFRKAPRETWNDDMVPFHEFLGMDEDEREGLFPYIWTLDAKNRLERTICSREIVKAAEERRAFWRQLKDIAGLLDPVDVEAAVNQAKAEMAGKLAATLLGLAEGGANIDPGALIAAPSGSAPAPSSAAAPGGAGAGAASGGALPADYEPVWIETPDCTTCDECVELAPEIFQYNDDDQAIVVNPRGGTFADIVRAAEKCTAGCIHPGTPWDMSEKNLDKLIQRAARFD
ncbi:MAG TPA: pyruvate ferredoxin oxidoreductase, partial [Thermopetrobacter sp.]|nr:pyruvate ferredoxin oxidoreductase [Thermopetrobacter sp.]